MSALSPIENNESRFRFERFLTFLAIDPNNILLRLQTIELGLECQAWNELEQIIQQGLSLYPDNTSLHSHAGTISLRNKQYSSACDHFNLALAKSDSISPAILYNHAFALFYLAEYEKAFSILRKIEHSFDLQKSTHLLSARCLHHMGKIDDAIEQINQIAEEDIDEETYGLSALLFYENQRTIDAFEAANRALTLNPRQLDALLARASLEVESENYDSARRDYNVATIAHPTCGRAWSGLAQIDMHDMQFDKAQAELELAVDLMPNHIGTWHMLAWIHILHGRAEEAKLAFDRSYEIDRNFSETHGGFAVVAAMQQQTKLSEQHIRRARKLNPEVFSAYYAELLLLNAEGKSDEVKVFYDRIMKNTTLPSGAIMGEIVKQRITELNIRPDSTIH